MNETNFLQSLEEVKDPLDKMTINHPDFLRPERLNGETDEQYYQRRVVNKLFLKMKKKGEFVWISKDLQYPVEDKTTKEVKHVVSQGFTYNKKKLEEALAEYNKKKELNPNTPITE